jgi:SET domain
MVYTFEFYSNGRLTFRGRLKGERCRGQKKDGAQCKRNSVIGCPYCYQHLQFEKHLRIKTSTIANSGKGLFAQDNSEDDRAIIFEPGDEIIEYIGERIDATELHRRYQIHTAPYAIQVRGPNNPRGGLYIDAAVIRGVGSLANHKPQRIMNAKLVINYISNTAKLRATKRIRNGTEIFVDYGSDYLIHEAGVDFKTKGLR